MKARFKSPGGTGIVEFDDDATIGAVYEMLQSRTGIPTFTIKTGPPMSMNTIDTNNSSILASSLRLNGETLTIVPEEARPELQSIKTNTNESSNTGADIAPQKANGHGQEIHVPWLEREGTLLLRVMPSDNSCLFTAFGGALPQQIPPLKLRQMMADYINQHLDVYTEAVLGAPTEEYCRAILNPDRWGGGIELSILSSIFNIRICTYDIQTQNLIAFGEDRTELCILAYSGIHYDRVAFSYSDFPHDNPLLPPEMDRTIWPSDDEELLEKANILVKELNSAHYYTDMKGLILKCDVLGCDWIGSGEFEGKRHAEKTGHMQLSEIQGNDSQSVLRKCALAGCDFLGQGEASTRKHTSETGHDSYHIIQDV